MKRSYIIEIDLTERLYMLKNQNSQGLDCISGIVYILKKLLNERKYQKFS
jgi:hypothetical protein